MKAELLTRYRLSLRLLSALHINSGKGELLRDQDFVVEGQQVLVIDIDRLLSEADEQTIRHFMADPRLTRLLRPGTAGRYSLYALRIERASPEEIRQIATHIRDGTGRLFLPGSSIKGAIRTALCWAAYRGPLGRLGGIQEGRRPDARRSDDPLERELFDYDLRNTTRDLFRALRIADAYPKEGVSAQVVPVGIFSLQGQPPSLRRRGRPIHLEVMPSGTLLEGELALDEYTMRPEHIQRGMRHYQKRRNLDSIAAHCRSFAAELIRREKEFFTRYGAREVRSFYEKLEGRLKALEPSGFLLPIGWGPGWRAKTIGTRLTIQEIRRVAESYRLFRWQRGLTMGEFPKSRRLVGYEGPSEPLGWLEGRLEPVG